MLGLPKIVGPIVLFGGEHVKVDFGGSQILPKAVMQLAGDSAALFVLHAHQTGGEKAEGCSALLHLSFKRIMGAAQCLFGCFALAKMIADLILPLPGHERTAYG